MCLRKSEATVDRISVCYAFDDLTEHGIQCLPCKWCHKFVTVAVMTSYWFYNDVIGMPFCQGTKYNIPFIS